MTRPSDTKAAATALGLASDRPPVGRFFIAFCALLALALGLAALSEAGAANDDDEPRAEARAEPAQHHPGR
jgi:hypothetical protein